jgi:imidazolonepropionase-like amidohydrolase
MPTRRQLLALLAAAPTSRYALAAERSRALLGATLIDGSGGPPLPDAALVIADGRIQAVGRREAVEIPAGAEVEELGGQWIVPGLIDAHIHFFQSGGLYTRPDIIDLRFARPYEDEIRAIRAALPATLARYLASGVTAVVDVGGPDWNLEVREDAARLDAAPRVKVAGPLLGTFAPPALAADEPAILRISSPAEARAEVRRQAALGVDLIKVWFVLRRPGIEPEMAWIRAAIEEAHAAGLRVVAHATQREVAAAVVEAGADILAHSIDDEAIDDRLLEAMATRGVIYTTTLMVRPRYRAVLGPGVELTPIERRLGDPAVIASWDDLETLPADRLPAWAGRVQPLPLSPVVAANLRRVQAAGITVAAGSDAGNIGTLHGPSLHHELELLVEAGLAPMEALLAAGRGGAAVIGRDDLGILAAGKLADLLVLAADPLSDISASQRISRVMAQGRQLDPEAIRRRLGD